ncbi:MAG TPA: hypothetical protein ENJ30_05890 [Desulfobulbaceae bacterium]|nr:hypothetical protein [Desulfobulbaceae bacterium]
MKNMHGCRLIFILMILATLVLTSGCANTIGKTQISSDDSALPPVSGFADDIQDIVLPTDMEWQRDKSMTIKTESFRGGVWYYTGRVEVVSLKDFMINSMKDNKWKLVGEATSKDVMLAFVKPNKTCMMVIADEAFGKTSLTLYVTIDKTAATALNPFGEAVGQ